MGFPLSNVLPVLRQWEVGVDIFRQYTASRRIALSHITSQKATWYGMTPFQDVGGVDLPDSLTLLGVV